MNFAVFILVFAGLFAIGMPIAFSMIISSVVYALIGGIDMSFFNLEGFKALYSFTLTAIPMFMLTAEVMNSSTVADKMFNFANSLTGWIPGGLGHTNIVTSVIFAGMSGSAAADTGGIGYLSYKAMKDRGFDPAFSAAVTAASACIGPIIPPSIPVVVYAMTITDASVGAMFLGGVIPGVLMALSMGIYIYFISKKRHYPVEKKPTARELGVAVRQGILPVLTPVILLVTIEGGLVTISEGAVVTVLYSCFLGTVIYHKFGVRTLWNCCKNICMVIGSILVFFIATKMFSYVLTQENLVNKISSAIYGITQTKLVVMLIINVFFLIMGCLSDPLVNIMLFAPIAWSLVKPLGVDANAFGIIVVFNCMIGLITPPVGGNAFLISGITKIPLQKIFKEILPFVVGLLVVLLLLSMFPEIISFLPNLLS